MAGGDFLLTFTCMRVLFSVWMLFALKPVNAQAKMDIDDSKKNFGFVKKGEVVRLPYVITNKGTEPLLISNVEIECSCTTAEYDKKPLLPQQSTTLTVVFDTKSTYDRQDRVVLVRSNDPDGPHKLRYKGVVLKK